MVVREICWCAGGEGVLMRGNVGDKRGMLEEEEFWRWKQESIRFTFLNLTFPLSVIKDIQTGHIHLDMDVVV